MKRAVEIVTEKIRIYIEKVNIDSSIELDGDILTIRFNQIPSQLMVTHIKQLIFFTNEIIIPDIDQVFKLRRKCIKVDLSKYEEFYFIFNSLKDFNCNVLIATLTENESISFECILKYQRDFTCKQLDAIQSIVNPQIANHDSIRVTYRHGISSISIDLGRTEEHFD